MPVLELTLFILSTPQFFKNYFTGSKNNLAIGVRALFQHVYAKKITYSVVRLGKIYIFEKSRKNKITKNKMITKI